MSTPSVDPLVGRLLDGRYQVRSRIARGGMATVYLATDLRLERRVAIKVMHGHLADDQEYKARFIQEARSAARLAHPNVVNVYDQGQDDDIAYLVMEYLPGITLRELLQERPTLTTEQALDIMESVLSGLAAAHRNGIVHRDLKPENVLLADDGRIKIGDFGLARAATAQTASGTALLGTIAYLSPELVTRGVADARSDIYAVGIILFEMLTGEQPFKGEEPFHIAHQHANSTVPSPSSVNPEVPAELDELVLWATARDPEQRPRDARSMLDQLHETQRVLRNRDSGGDVNTPATEPQATMVLPSPASTAETQVLGRRPVAVAETPTGNTVELTRLSDKRSARGTWLFVFVMLLAALAGATGWYFGAGPGSLVTVPDVSGEKPAAATALLKDADLVVAAENLTTYSVSVPAGLVVGTDPEAGTAVAHRAEVSLIISLGAELLPVPEVLGEAESDAGRSILAARFTLGESIRQFSDTVPSGRVIALQGVDADGEVVPLTAEDSYPEQQPISLIVSVGKIPEVDGLTVDDALKALQARDLIGSVSEDRRAYSDTVPKGDVVGLVLPDGPVRVDDTLQLIVSDGIEQVKIPEIVGKTWRQAEEALTAAGFRYDFKNAISRFLSGVPDSSTVKSVEPGEGQTVDKGSTVVIALQAG